LSSAAVVAVDLVVDGRFYDISFMPYLPHGAPVFCCGG
jgi:hypothetical protein